MSAIRVEDDAYPKAERLSYAIGLPDDGCIGILTKAWRHVRDTGSDLVSEAELRARFRVTAPGLVTALLEVGFIAPVEWGLFRWKGARRLILRPLENRRRGAAKTNEIRRADDHRVGDRRGDRRDDRSTSENPEASKWHAPCASSYLTDQERSSSSASQLEARAKEKSCDWLELAGQPASTLDDDQLLARLAFHDRQIADPKRTLWLPRNKAQREEVVTELRARDEAKALADQKRREEAEQAQKLAQAKWEKQLAEEQKQAEIDQAAEMERQRAAWIREQERDALAAKEEAEALKRRQSMPSILERMKSWGPLPPERRIEARA